MNDDTIDSIEPTKTIVFGSRVVHLKGAVLEVVSGPARGQLLKMSRASVTVGKGQDVDMQIEDPSMSRRHLEVVLTPEGFFLRDLGSRNGTWVGGLRIKEAIVEKDTVVTLGHTHLAIRPGRSPLELEVSASNEFGGALGASFAMRHVFSILEKASDSNSTILLEGESGTGKEVLARAVHQKSKRAEGPFVVVDCSSIPENLVESELFGHDRGAFTGAVEAREGAFEQADGGTIFLDELGELPLSQQAKLLRVIENQEIRRVGGSKVIPIDVRVVAATNVRLADAVRRGAFREDLFYRLSVVYVCVPPLRDRKDDIPALAARFLQRIRGADAQIPQELQPVLTSHGWPGNVRELRNVIERWAMFENANPQVLFGTPVGKPGGDHLDLAEGSLQHLAALPYHEAKAKVLEALDRAYFPAVLARAGGVVTKAAEMANVPRPSFHRMMTRARGRGEPGGGPLGP